MKRAFTGMAVVVLMLSAIMSAQTAPQMPQPGPEVKKLDYFVGHWTMTGESQPSPYGPGGKFSGTETDEWMPGNFFVVVNSQGSSPMGQAKALAILGYKPDEKVYTYHSFDSMGMAEEATGTVEGDTWTWLSEDKMGGKPVKGRYTIKVLSPASYTFKLETASDNGDWKSVMEGKVTKTK